MERGRGHRATRRGVLLIVEQLVMELVDFVQCRYAPLHRNEQRKAVQQRHRVDHQRRQHLRSGSAAVNTNYGQLSITHECNINTINHDQSQQPLRITVATHSELRYRLVEVAAEHEQDRELTAVGDQRHDAVPNAHHPATTRADRQ